MFDEQRLGDDGTEASRPSEPDDGDNQMKEKDDDIAHPGMVSKPEKHLILVAQFGNSPWTGCLKNSDSIASRAASSWTVELRPNCLSCTRCIVRSRDSGEL